MTAYRLAKMVGPTGRVYAFEPDETNFEYLLLNIEMHGLSNVTPVKAALSDKTGNCGLLHGWNDERGAERVALVWRGGEQPSGGDAGPTGCVRAVWIGAQLH
jgi:FkbM family methyltransferase